MFEQPVGKRLNIASEVFPTGYLPASELFKLVAMCPNLVGEGPNLVGEASAKLVQFFPFYVQKFSSKPGVHKFRRNHLEFSHDTLELTYEDIEVPPEFTSPLLELHAIFRAFQANLFNAVANRKVKMCLLPRRGKRIDEGHEYAHVINKQHQRTFTTGYCVLELNADHEMWAAVGFFESDILSMLKPKQPRTYTALNAIQAERLKSFVKTIIEDYDAKAFQQKQFIKLPIFGLAELAAHAVGVPIQEATRPGSFRTAPREEVDSDAMTVKAFAEVVDIIRKAIPDTIDILSPANSPTRAIKAARSEFLMESSIHAKFPPLATFPWKK